MVVITHLAGKGAWRRRWTKRQPPRTMQRCIDLPLVFTVLMGVAILAYVVLDGYDLGVGMLMPAAEPRRAEPHGGLDRPVLGRERDLAGARHRPAAGRVPGGARRDPRRALPAGGGDAGRADAARRGVRVAHQGRGLAPRAVELAVLGRLVRSPASRRASCSGATSPASQPGIGYWLFALVVGGGAVRRLRAARRDLARASAPTARCSEKAVGLGALGPAVGRARRRRW